MDNEEIGTQENPNNSMAMIDVSDLIIIDFKAWVNVEERLPKEDDLVLTYHPDYVFKYKIGSYHKAQKCFVDAEDYGFWCTHWFSIPQPPNEQSEKDLTCEDYNPNVGSNLNETIDLPDGQVESWKEGDKIKFKSITSDTIEFEDELEIDENDTFRLKEFSEDCFYHLVKEGIIYDIQRI